MNILNVHVGDNGSLFLAKSEDLKPSIFAITCYEDHKNLLNPKREAGTCEWVTEHPTFQAWKSSRDSLLWISADPGCGKSVLSRAIIDDRLIGTESSTICYFFFKDNNEEQKNLRVALCAILHQLFSAHKGLLAKHAPKSIKNTEDVSKIGLATLWGLLISAATDVAAGDVFCVLDALDECTSADRDVLIQYLSSFNEGSTKKSEQKSRLKFLVTSRPYKEIHTRFSRAIEAFPTIWLAGELESESISREIEIVMKARINKIAADRKLKDDVRIVLQQKLISIPNRTYLWLHLIMDEVERGLGTTERKLLRIIETLPQTVSQAYEKILARCDRNDGKRLLSMIVAAGRPLTLDEIDVALEITDDSESLKDLDLEGPEKRAEWIRECCGLFVSVIDSRVFLIHQTATEFLVQKVGESNKADAWENSIEIEEAHRELLKACATYLAFPENITYKHVVQLPQFLDYSACHWIIHAQKAGIYRDKLLEKTAKLCNIQSDTWWTDQWYKYRHDSKSQGYMFEYEFGSKSPRLVNAVAIGLINETSFFLGSCNFERGALQGALKEAARNESYGKELVELFIDLQGNYITLTKDVVSEVLSNHSQGAKIMSLLLDRRGNEVKITESVFIEAARSDNVEVMALLLDRRGNQMKITEHDMVLAAFHRAVKVMALLLDRRGDEVKITENVVIGAASPWNAEVMALLLDRGGDEVKITEEVLKRAVWDVEVMAVLLDRRGNEVKITEEVLIGVRCNLETMTLLLDRLGSEVKITEELLIATAPHVEVMALLLDRRGNEVKITEKVLMSAAHIVGAMALLLYHRGDEVKITEKVLMGAAWDVEVMALLLNRRGNEVKITEEVLIAAAENVEVMALLLDRRGNEVKITKKVLMAAAGSWRAVKVMRLLLDRRGNEVKITEEVLKRAAGSWRAVKVMRLLLDRRGNEVKITEEVLKGAAESQWKVVEAMTLLLDRRGNEVKITQEVVDRVLKNEESGQELLQLLRNRRPEEMAVLRIEQEPVRKEWKMGWEVGPESMLSLELEMRKAGHDLFRYSSLHNQIM